MMIQNARKKVVRGEADAGARRQAVIDIVAGQLVGSQAELADLLAQRGFQVTQATLSRDLKALGIGKIPTRGKGYAYVLPTAGGLTNVESDETLETSALESLVKGVKLVHNLVLVRTVSGQALGIGRVVDNLAWNEVEGTISGDDTVMVVTSGADRAQRFCERFSSLVGVSSLEQGTVSATAP